MMTVTDAFCRVNRARGLELLSPDDLVRAIKVSKDLGLPLQLKSFPSGLSVLHLASADSESAAMEAVRKQLEDAYGAGGLTAEKLSRDGGGHILVPGRRQSLFLFLKRRDCFKCCYP